MATLNVIYKIAADISGLQSGVDRAAQATEKMRDGLASLQRSVIEAFSGDAIVEFAKGMLEAGHNIEKMAAQTGIGVDQVQKLQYIAGQSGSAVESLVGAMQNLEQRIGSENSGAAGAMAKLGIEMDAFNKLNGYEQMALLGDAITSIKDPTEQASDAAALFGKTWKEILPALKSGFKETGEQAAIMSDETVKALADGEKRMLAFKQTLTSWAGTALGAFEKVGNAVGQFLSTFNPEHFGVTTNQVLKFAAAVNDPTGLLGALEKVPPKALEMGAALGSVALNASEAAGVTFDLVRQGNESITMHKEAAKAAKEHADELLKLGIVGTNIFGGMISITGDVGSSYQDLTFKVQNYGDATVKMTADARDYLKNHRDEIQAAADAMDNLTASSNAFNKTLVEMADGTHRTYSAIATLPNVLSSLDHSLDTVYVSIGRTFGDQVDDVLGGMIKILHTARTAFTDFAATAATGAKTIIDSWKNTHSVFDLVVNAAATAISLIAKLFTNAEQQVNPVRQAFVDLHGGLAALNAEAFAAGTTLTAMLNAKNPEQYQIAIDALNKALDAQKAKTEAATKALGDLVKQANDLANTLPPAVQDAINKMITLASETGTTQNVLDGLAGVQQVNFATMRDIAQKYGVDLKALGPKFEAARISDTAQGIINDFDTLQRGLGDTDEALRIMRKPINDLVNDSLKFGVAIPANMKPWVDQLLLTGQLLDDNGNAITDISQLKFADPIKTEFQKIIDKLQELIDKIAGVATGINSIPAKKEVELVTTHTDIYRVERADESASFAATGGIVTATGIQHFAAGGNVRAFRPRGSDTVPAMLTPGEMVLTRGQQAAVFGHGGGGVNVVNNFSVAANVDTPANREALRKVVDDATMQALRRQKRTNVA